MGGEGSTKSLSLLRTQGHDGNESTFVISRRWEYMEYWTQVKLAIENLGYLYD